MALGRSVPCRDLPAGGGRSRPGASFSVRNADDDALGDVGTGLETVLDLGRVHVLPAAQDQVGATRREVEEAVLEASEVAGSQPTTGPDRGGGGVGIAPVLEHDERATHVDL